jgi:predicted nucleic acid-binding protein
VICYLDTSVLLRVLLRAGRTLPEWGRWERALTSELAGVEARRAVDRLRVIGALDDDGVVTAHRALVRLEREIARIPLARTVLRRASLPMPTATKTLDAIHLASALVYQERRGGDVVFATHDAQQARAAAALGFDCVGT